MTAWALGGERFLPDDGTARILSEPRDPGWNLSGEFVEGVVSSFGLGTVLRGAQIPAGAPTTKRRTGRFGVESDEEFEARRKEAGALDEDAWRASDFFREDIPWDRAMTEARASALADWHDERAYRQGVSAQRRGVASNVAGFVGALGGQALDPINYVPFVGTAARGWAIGRAGVVGGHVLAASADAAINTAIFGAATMGERARFGDHVGADAFLTEVVTAALIGSAFGGMVGGVAKIRGVDVAPARLARDERIQIEGRARLNEAVEAIVHDRPPDIRAEAVREAVEAVRGARAATVRAEAAAARDAADFIPDDLLQMVEIARARLPADPERALPKHPARAVLKSLGGVDPDSPLATELGLIGITPKSAPGLFVKGGLQRADNIPASEHPIFRFRGEETDLAGQGYIREDDLFAALRDEMDGAPWRTEAEAEARMAYQDAAENQAAHVELLRDMGIDLGRMTQAEIRARLREVAKMRSAPATPREDLTEVADLAAAREAVGRRAAADEAVEAVDYEVLNADLARLREAGRLSPEDEAALREAADIESRSVAYAAALDAVAACRA